MFSILSPYPGSSLWALSLSPTSSAWGSARLLALSYFSLSQKHGLTCPFPTVCSVLPAQGQLHDQVTLIVPHVPLLKRAVLLSPWNSSIFLSKEPHIFICTRSCKLHSRSHPWRCFPARKRKSQLHSWPDLTKPQSNGANPTLLVEKAPKLKHKVQPAAAIHACHICQIFKNVHTFAWSLLEAKN